MSKHDLTIFRYSTMLVLTRNGISTIAELEAMRAGGMVDEEVTE